MKQLVSILIPAFNAEPWIQDCLDSALSQTWSRKEIIVVDDGSRDATGALARRYSAAGVLVEAQENRGASAARNRALSLAQGEYIQWLDADDILAPDKIARQMERAGPGMTSSELLSGPWGRFYRTPEKAESAPDSLWETQGPKEWLYRKIRDNRWMAIESWLVSRKLTEMAGPWNETMSLDDDGEYFCRVLMHSTGVRFVPEAWSFCRRGNRGMTHSPGWDDRKLNSMALSLFSQIEALRSMEDSPRVREACILLLNRWSIDFYPERIDMLDRMQSLAASLGGRLAEPELRAKYRWLQKVFGWRMAKKAQYVLPAIHQHAVEAWEHGWQLVRKALR